MNRVTERRIAFELIFSFPFNKESTAEQIIESYIDANGDENITEYVIHTVKGVLENIEAIDEKIKSSIQARKFERLDSVCLAALRLATYEIYYNNDIPTGVAVNEAIELTKKYDDSLAAFVHGNLSIIAKGKDE